MADCTVPESFDETKIPDHFKSLIYKVLKGGLHGAMEKPVMWMASFSLFSGGYKIQTG